MKSIIVAIGVAAFFTPSAYASRDIANEAKALVIRLAPNKQVDSLGRVNPTIGRTPGAACEAIRFLAKYKEAYPEDRTAIPAIRKLAAWVQSIQDNRPKSVSFGGVPSTPDLPAPGNSYYYTIDSALCGEGFLAAYRVTGDQSIRTSAIRFADFIVRAHDGPSGPQRNWFWMIQTHESRGFCEFVLNSGQTAWNCDAYIKNMIALPVLKKVGQLTGNRRYNDVAKSARNFLMPGLIGHWEHTSRGNWARINGPNREPNYFVYGDTIAYALRGLFEYEGLSNDVKRVYDSMAAYKGKGPRTLSYDSRIAYAGYLRPDVRQPDELSAYYDLVTLGILHPIRKAYRPSDAAVATLVMQEAFTVSKIAWRMSLDRPSTPTRFVDVTTIINIGEAALLDR